MGVKIDNNFDICVTDTGHGKDDEDLLSTDLNQHTNNTQVTNDSPEEIDDSDENNETSDSSLEKLNKKCRQSAKYEAKQNIIRKQGKTKENNNNDIHKMNRASSSTNVVNNEKCRSCGQFLNDSGLLYYQGHPQNAVEESVALTDEKLVLATGKLILHLGFNCRLETLKFLVLIVLKHLIKKHVGSMFNLFKRFSFCDVVKHLKYV